MSILNGQLSNNISGIITIKSYTAEAYENQRIRRLSESYQDRNQRAIRLSSACLFPRSLRRFTDSWSRTY